MEKEQAEEARRRAAQERAAWIQSLSGSYDSSTYTSSLTSQDHDEIDALNAAMEKDFGPDWGKDL